MRNTLLLLCLLATGAMFGFFYAWTCSTMWGLDAAPPQIAIAAMQAMNASVRNATFAPAFFGTGPLLLLTAAVLFAQTARRSATLIALAAACYILGAFGPTFAVNVPMNTALAQLTVSTDDSAASATWAAYSPRWQFWNQIRTVAAAAALLLTGAGLLALPPRKTTT